MPKMSDTSNHEALGGVMKKKPPMAHSRPGTTSTDPEETLQGGKAKKKEPMAHMGPRSTSDKDEALGGVSKKKPAMVGNSGNTAPGDAEGYI